MVLWNVETYSLGAIFHNSWWYHFDNMHTFDIDTKSKFSEFCAKQVMCEFKEKYHIDEINMEYDIFQEIHTNRRSAQNLDKLLIQ